MLLSYHERAVGVLQGSVGGQDRVIRLNDGVGESRSGIHAELELGLLAIVRGETLEDEGTETGTSSTTERVEDKEALETRAVIGKPANLVHHGVDHLFANGVVTTRI